MGSKKHPTGSVLIWTIALGMIMTSVFLFMTLRLNRNATLSRETLDFVQNQAYLESYMAYIKQLKADEWRALKENGLSYDGITGTLTNEVEEIQGVLDYGQSLTLPLNTYLSVEWNTCSHGILKEDGVLESDPPFNSNLNPSCGVSTGVSYDRLSLIHGSNTTFTLTSTGEPTHYRISSTEPLEGNQWILNLQAVLKNGRRLKLQEKWEGV